MNPFSTTIRNVAVPGITLHEANVLTQPQSNTCKPLPGFADCSNKSSTARAARTGRSCATGRSWARGSPIVNAAAQLKPTLALVWLGANDVLKFMGSGGLFHGGDSTPGQAAADLRQTIETLKRAGAHVVAANLPNILETPYFMRVTIVPQFSNSAPTTSDLRRLCSSRPCFSCRTAPRSRLRRKSRNPTTSQRRAAARRRPQARRAATSRSKERSRSSTTTTRTASFRTLTTESRAAD